jgi:hypothetical protein
MVSSFALCLSHLLNRFHVSISIPPSSGVCQSAGRKFPTEKQKDFAKPNEWSQPCTLAGVW